MSDKITFSPAQVEQLARVLGDCGTGGDIDYAFASINIVDQSRESTKWRRLRWAFDESLRRNRNANEVLKFIEVYLDPVRFAGRAEQFDDHREAINTVLAFSGLVYEADGKFHRRQVARTLTQAENRSRRIKSRLSSRRVHPQVSKYCDAELMQDNYFHAVFEASKGLLKRIQEQSGIDLDGERLIQKVFLGDAPLLAFNTLTTETERNEQRGIALLMQGCVAAIRNPLAHEPKILWDGENDAADYLTLISLLHSKLDDAVTTKH